MTVRPQLSNPQATRVDAVDALRGVAMLWMAVFHFCFDLNHFGLIQQNFHTQPLWTGQRTAIVTLFLLCVGIGQSLAQANGQTARRFWRRWLQVAGCAALVSAATWWMFPRSYISFGILHGIAAMLLVVRLLFTWRLPTPLWGLLGAVALSAPTLWQHPVFDSRSMNWVGLVTHKPVTEDYVPLLPWLGVVMWGVAAGRWLVQMQMQAPALWPVAMPAWGRPLAVLGRFSLSFYMLHQPVLWGLLMLWR